MPKVTKWKVQQAVRASTLPPTSRLIMHTLIAVADTGTAEIPPQHTPSLTVLADETGLDRSTISRHLNDLESAGWVGRDRPDVHAARLRWERTTYRLSVPVGFEPRRRGQYQPPEVDADDTQVGAQDTQDSAEPRRTEHPDLGAQDTHPRCTVQPSSEITTDQLQIKDSSSATPPKAEPQRLDVERICSHLADRIEANGSKRPAVNEKWRTAARLLLDRDGRTVDQALAAIDWCQADEFWRANILSLPKLRERYDQLRLAAQRARAAPGQPPPSRNQQILAAARERALAAEGAR